MGERLIKESTREINLSGKHDKGRENGKKNRER